MTRDKLMDDWRRVCNSLNTSPDSDVEVVLTKVRVLQSIARENAHAIAAAVQAERDNARTIEVALRSLIEDIEQFPGEFDADTESVGDARIALNTYMDAQAAASRARSGQEENKA